MDPQELPSKEIIVDAKVLPELRLSPQTSEIIQPTWQTFRAKLDGFGFGKKDLDQFEKEFHTSLYVSEQLNNGNTIEEVAYAFLPNELTYHNFKHTVHVVDRTLKLLPGFLKKLNEEGISIQDPIQFSRIKALVHASIFHEIGYLKRRMGDEIYEKQNELYFDHVDRGIEFATKIVKSLDIQMDQDFFTKMIRSTDFNQSWVPADQTKRNPEEKYKDAILVQSDISRRWVEWETSVRRWGGLMEAADFLGAMTQSDHIPERVAGLYEENMGKIIMTEKDKTTGEKAAHVKMFVRDESGNIILDEYGKPKLTNSIDPKNQYARIIEYKFGNPIERNIPVSEVSIPTKQEFVTSPFMESKKRELQEFIDFADEYYGSHELNELEKGYTANINRIRNLHGSAAPAP